ncbi:hypothetical protein BPY_09200 [Bifidobacterium psychraerophilum]|uniref:FRG domain-containing protein n=1 Tax=Bifidobacterium psychraerophilum TaxID=218140 RepID=UPI00310E57F3
MPNKVASVSEFLYHLRHEVSALRTIFGSDLFVYRGESELYPTAEKPNLFRNNTKRNYLEFPKFEKNVLDEFKSYRFSDGESYLELAIDAQHGEFPSRLLDISFNSLIALFFAVHSPEKSSNPLSDSAVYIYVVDDLYSPVSKDVQDFYESIVTKNPDHTTRLSGYNHIFIDFLKSNPRISAQKGGFILFPGTDYVPLPQFRKRRIIIEGTAKKNILAELQTYFGITVGTIYPESTNNVAYLSQKASHLANHTISPERDQQAFLTEFDENCSYYACTLSTIIKSTSIETLPDMQLRQKIEPEIAKIEKTVAYAKATWDDYRTNMLATIDVKSFNVRDKEFTRRLTLFRDRLQSMLVIFNNDHHTKYNIEDWATTRSEGPNDATNN